MSNLFKDWKARAHAYDQILREGQRGIISSGDVATFMSEAKSSLGDSIAPAQEKALEAFLVILKKIRFTAPLVSDICETVAKRCLGNKPKIKEKGMQCLAALMELGHGTLMHESLVSQGLKSANPKVVTGTLEFYTEAVL